MEIETRSKLCLLNFGGDGDECGFLSRFCLNIQSVEHCRFQSRSQARIRRLELLFLWKALGKTLQVHCLMALESL
jgi:hypothetical protein